VGAEGSRLQSQYLIKVKRKKYSQCCVLDRKDQMMKIYGSGLSKEMDACVLL
jgi:hypothetical protein